MRHHGHQLAFVELLPSHGGVLSDYWCGWLGLAWRRGRRCCRWAIHADGNLLLSSSLAISWGLDGRSRGSPAIVKGVVLGAGLAPVTTSISTTTRRIFSRRHRQLVNWRLLAQPSAIHHPRHCPISHSVSCRPTKTISPPWRYVTRILRVGC